MSEEEILNIEVDEFLSSEEFKSSRPKIIGVDIGVNAKGSQMRYWVATDIEINDEIKKYIKIKDNKIIITNQDVAKSIKIKPYKKRCNCCGTLYEDKQIKDSWSKGGSINDNFYQDFDTLYNFDGYSNLCKNCMISMCDDSNGVIDQKKLIEMLMRMGKVYNHTKFLNVFENKQSSKHYLSSISSLSGQREKNFFKSNKEGWVALIERAKEENENLDFDIDISSIDFIQESNGYFSEDIEQDGENDNESLLSNSKRRKLIKKWGNKDDNDLIYLDDKFNEICANYKFSESTKSKYEDSIIELCDWLLASRNSTEVSDKKIISDSIDKLTKSLGMQRKDDKEADSGLSVGEVLAVAEKHEGFVNHGKYKTKYNANQDLIDKTLTIFINVSRRSVNNGAKMIKSLYDLLDSNGDDHFNIRNLNVNDHLDEVDLDVSNFNLDYESVLEREEAFYKNEDDNYEDDDIVE